MIDDQLKWVIDFLQSKKINFWVDSGTLLGIIRDGHTIKEDNDIDIGMWASDINIILSALKKQIVYKIKIFKYRKYIFKIKLYNNIFKYTIDINLFRINRDNAWCPQTILVNQKDIYSIKKYFHFIFIPIIYRLKERWPFSIDYYDFFWRPFHASGVWLIPKTFFEELIYFGPYKIPVPRQYDSYLSLRYGNWRIKNSKWNFWEDDKGLKHNIHDYIEFA